MAASGLLSADSAGVHGGRCRVLVPSRDEEESPPCRAGEGQCRQDCGATELRLQNSAGAVGGGHRQ